MTTLTAVDDRYASRGATGTVGATDDSSGTGVAITLSVTALVLSTFLVAGYLEYVALAAAGLADAGGWGTAFLTRDLLAGSLRTGLTAFGIGLGPVLVLRALPGVRIRSWRGPIALFAAGVATVLCIVGLFTTLG